jgi:hypothetical protein
MPGAVPHGAAAIRRHSQWSQPTSTPARPLAGGKVGGVTQLSDSARQAIILVAGDKAGRWSGWYAEAILLAEERYAAYQHEGREKEQ